MYLFLKFQRNILTLRYFLKQSFNSYFEFSQKMEKSDYRSYIKIRSNLGIPPIEIFNELKLAYPDQAPSHDTVVQWARSFKEGKTDLEDAPRPGRPITAHTEVNIALVRAVIESDPHSTIDDIVAETSLSRGNIERIISESLKMRKVTSRWVPHFLSGENRKERVDACRENLAVY